MAICTEGKLDIIYRPEKVNALLLSAVASGTAEKKLNKVLDQGLPLC
jgi:hypothetical protein